MTTEILRASCPADSGAFADSQNLTDLQTIVNEAAIDIHNNPLLTADIAIQCSDKLAIRYLDSRDPTSPNHALTEFELLGNVRRAIPQALGFRAVYAAMPGITEVLEAGFPSETSPLPTKYDAPLGHTHTGEEARLMRLVAGRIGRITMRTLGSFTTQERTTLQDNFEKQTKYAADATLRVLDNKYGPTWRQIPEEIRRSPYESDINDRVLLRLLGKLASRSPSLEMSFQNAIISGAESGVIMLKHLREALDKAKCPRELWVPLAYANAARLNLPSSMSFWDAKQLNEVDIQDQAQPIFTVSHENDSWDITFTISKYEKIYNRNRPAGCQGAFILPPQDERSQTKLADWHKLMIQRSQGLKMDTDYRKGIDAAQMATISAIAMADREEYL